MRILFVIILFSLSSTYLFPQWIQQNSGTSDRFLTCYFLNNNVGWAAGDNGTIVRTNDGGENWFSQSINTLDNIHSIFFVDSLNGWIALYEFNPDPHGSIKHTTDGGETWVTQLWVDFITLHDVFFTDANNGYSVGSSGALFKTTNGGQNWFFVSPISGYWLYSSFFFDQNVGWVSGDFVGFLLRTTNGGQSWSFIGVPVTQRLMSIYFNNSNYGWSCGAGGKIILTTNGGLDWAAGNTGVNVELRDIRFVDPNEGWSVGLNGKIIHSSDGGANWYQQNSGTNYNLYGVYFADAQNGWVVGDQGIILKTNNGGVPVELVSLSAEQNKKNQIQLSWITATETNNQGFEIERKYSDQDEWNTIGFVEGFGTTTEIHHYSYEDDLNELSRTKSIFYRLKQIDFNGTFEYSKEVEVVLTPVSYSLSQNYPNPFNPSTTITFSLPKKISVKLVIYDINGSLVKILVNKQLDAGNHSVKFKSDELSSGIYYYRLQSSDFIETKKMILLK